MSRTVFGNVKNADGTVPAEPVEVGSAGADRIGGWDRAAGGV
jgi:hypothetical protein